MHTTTLCRSGVFSTATRWSPTRLTWLERADRLGGVREQRLLEARIAPGLRHHALADVRPDLRLVGLDDQIERGGIDVALLGQDRLERAHAQLQLGELGAVVVASVAVILVVLGDGVNVAERRFQIGVKSCKRT